VRGKDSLLSKAQRRLAWFGFVLLGAYAPVVAYAKPDDTWMLSITVAGLVAMVLIIDDFRRRRPRHPALSDSVGETEQ